LPDSDSSVSIRRLRLYNYKAFQRFDLRLTGDAFLVGPNNAGKSTLIEAIKGSSMMLKWASQRRPDITRQDKGQLVWAYKMTSQRSEIEDENLRHNFRSVEARLVFELSNDTVLTAVWPAAVDATGSPTGETPYFFVREKGRPFIFNQRPGTWRKKYVDIGVVPTLSPVVRRERVLTDDYLEEWVRTRRVSQHARNHLRRLDLDGEFDKFVSFVTTHLREIDQLEVSDSINEDGEREIDVYYRERGDRVPKEICWAGDGLQIYLQILWFAWYYRKHSIVVFDEPDVFLHADLQRRLVRVLEALDAQVVTATHSPEMLGEASDESVIWIDKARPSAIRRPDPATLQDLSTQIGSGFNLRLASALRASTVLFVEGKDMKMLRTIASAAGCDRLATEAGIATIALGGSTRWVGVDPFKWLIDGFLGSSVDVAVILDRDFKSDDEVAEIQSALRAVGVWVHVWRRSEIENYLIDPALIAKASGESVDDVLPLLEAAFNACRPSAVAQMLAAAIRNRGSLDESTAAARVLEEVDASWSSFKWRAASLPGKDILAALNRGLQQAGYSTVSVQKIAGVMTASSVPSEMLRALREIESLR
jgi:predicted ATPase